MPSSLLEIAGLLLIIAGLYVAAGLAAALIGAGATLIVVSWAIVRAPR